MSGVFLSLSINVNIYKQLSFLIVMYSVRSKFKRYKYIGYKQLLFSGNMQGMSDELIITTFIVKVAPNVTTNMLEQMLSARRYQR